MLSYPVLQKTQLDHPMQWIITSVYFDPPIGIFNGHLNLILIRHVLLLSAFYLKKTNTNYVSSIIVVKNFSNNFFLKFDTSKVKTLAA